MNEDEKKERAERNEEIPLIYSSNGCFEGTDQFTNREDECENGVEEKFVKNENNLSVVFSKCLETGYIVLIICLIVGMVVLVLIVLFLSPLRKVVFPHRRNKSTKRINHHWKWK